MRIRNHAVSVQLRPFERLMPTLTAYDKDCSQLVAAKILMPPSTGAVF
jgi:hypothetical protein